MKTLSRSSANINSELPIKILQFGEGNFLRAFADWMIDTLNEKSEFNAGVAVVQPIANGMVDMLEKQECLYHLLMRGLADGEVTNKKRLISCIQKTVNPFIDPESYFDLASKLELSLIFSNTTEAGIVFNPDDKPVDGELAKTFPGKLTQFLWTRFEHFQGAESAGLGIIPCELIDRNGDKLKHAILRYIDLWNLSEGFKQWIEQANYFGNTLVDRIVPGYPREEIDQIKQDLGFDDNMVVAAEIFHLWIIEGPKQLQKKFPADQIGLNVKFVDDMTPYRTRKVRILNGSHTSMVPVGMLAEIETVKQAVEDDSLGPFIHQLIFEEIIPTLDLPEEELHTFANSVIERFRNPFIRHELKSISLNSISKFKVRVLPSILSYIEMNGKAPKRLSFAFASLIRLYATAGASGISLSDNAEYLDFFKAHEGLALNSSFIAKVLSREDFWGQDLSTNNLLMEAVANAFETLNQKPVNESLEMIHNS